MSDSPFQSILDLQEQLKKKIREDGKEILKAELNKFLEKHPEVHALIWAQSANVYNDESYDFRVFGIDILVRTDLSWSEKFYDLVNEEMDKDASDLEHFYNNSGMFLRECADELPEHKDVILSIKEDLQKLNNSIPEEVLEVFGDVSVRVTREGIFMADYEYGY